MIEASEHLYDDDPTVGPPDVRTVLKDVSYFFLGNGLIQAAVQFAPGGEGTPLGLLLMDPERLGRKRQALTMDPEIGLAATMIEVRSEEGVFRPSPDRLAVRWEECESGPAVRAEWAAGPFEIGETFWWPDAGRPLLIRRIELRRVRPGLAPVSIRTGASAAALERDFVVAADLPAGLDIGYEIGADGRTFRAFFVDAPVESSSAAAYWAGLARAAFEHPLLERFFASSLAQLPAVVSRGGRLDGSIWQYNREWVRDQSVIASALVAAGEREKARTILDRLVSRFVTDEGDTVDSSERRGPDEVELDQNGYLLLGLKSYALWTGDFELAEAHWPKIEALAEFPLREVFRHPASGLLMNRREYWERHRLHGIETGFELIHQVMVAVGLDAASVLARTTGRPERAERWEAEAARLRRAYLEDRRFRLADNRGFIKRRSPDGRVQETIEPPSLDDLPPGVPLGSAGPHFLNPDTEAALPIVLGQVPPDSPLARLTLSALETLWSQSWAGGGYGRYHVSSEPDSPGPWPFASLFVARASAEMGRADNVWRILEWMASLPGAAAGSWFEFYGPRPSPPCPQAGIIPWTWAEMILLLLDQVLGVRPEERGLRVRPRPLAGMGAARADLIVRGARVVIDLAPSASRHPAAFTTDGAVLERGEGDVLLAYTDRPLHLRIG